MPINYQPAEPFSPSAAAAYGALTQANQDRDYALRQQALEQQAQLERERMRMGNLAQQQQAMNEQDRMREQESMAAQAQAEHRFQREALLRPSERDQWLAGQQADMQYRHYQAQSALMNQQWGIQDDLQYQKLKNAEAWITSNPEYAPEEKAQALARIHGVLGPLEMRKQRSEAQIQEQHARLYEEQAKRQAALDAAGELTHEAIRTGNLSKLPRIKDPVTGVESIYGFNGKEYYDITLPGRELQMKIDQAKAAAAEKKDQRDREKWVGEVARVDRDVEKSLANWVKEQNKEPTPEEKMEKQESLRREAMQRRGLGDTFETHQANKQGVEDRVQAMFTGTAKPRNDADKFAAEVGRRAVALPSEDRQEVKKIVETVYAGRMQYMPDDDLKEFMGKVDDYAQVFPVEFLLSLGEIAKFRAGQKKPVAAQPVPVRSVSGYVPRGAMRQ